MSEITSQFFICVISKAAFNLSQAFVYDANGNLIHDGQFYYEYNTFNQLAKIRLHNTTGAVVSSYVYDPQGNRVYKRDGQKNEPTFYVNQNLVRTINSTGFSIQLITKVTLRYFVARKRDCCERPLFLRGERGSRRLCQASSDFRFLQMLKNAECLKTHDLRGAQANTLFAARRIYGGKGKSTAIRLF